MTPEERKARKRACDKARFIANPEKVRAQKRAWAAANPENGKARGRAWAAANPEKLRAWNASYNMSGMKRAQRYSLTVEDVGRMFAQQENCCKLCAISFNVKKPNIDHCHITGRVRGILCTKCNTRLGFLEKRGPVELLKDLDYLGWP